MAAAEQSVDGVDRRALTQYLTVLEDQGRVRDCPGQYLVVSQSGSEYLIDARLEACECPDHEFRDRECKHLKRVAYATGQREIPPIVDRGDVDDQLGEHCSGTPRWSR
ncbi:hypothetical protein [Natronolimnobius baerhuensis]|uniref:SWIM-type domain-containing protein n=1 Tax=Natronolimnobius baerhuensis TaxID=253108 RepID=A0A202E4N5_9EURY|nr:hypothetical protein [Natronolimnobius baerhuensis]OVE83179.1 hypothetical protein B2G88_17375 [Natronolimnobius baerhuensis]